MINIRNILIILLLIIILSFLVWFFFIKREKYNLKIYTESDTKSDTKYNGVVLFDIDGTLSTGIENEKVVQYFIDRNYVVGISTAGAMYFPGNLLSFTWMPHNLYNWMEKHNFDTFNNVASGILCGKYNPEAFEHNNERNDLDIYNMFGWRKGLTLAKTAEKYGITDPTKMYLLDNDPSYLKGISIYNPKFNLICAGKPCGKTNMGMHTILPKLLLN
jgi:hypothetical protein